jgi:hypothetical protein
MSPAPDSADLGFARLDLQRPRRTGQGETVYGAGKTPEQLLSILRAFLAAGSHALVTRATEEQHAFLLAEGLPHAFNPLARTLSVRAPRVPRPRLGGLVAVCTGGTADLPVAEEAAETLAFFGARVERHYDVGVAGLHRLLSAIEDIRRADAVIAVAGMEGALASVVAGLVSAPVVAVPTSVGYGASFGGIAPLLSMLNGCAEGVGVVNIDNGFGAAALACRILAAKNGKTGKNKGKHA